MFGNGETYFHVVLLWSILVYKIPQFWAKAIDPDSPRTFLERRHPEVTKNLKLCFVPQGEPKKKGISSWTINITQYFL